MVLSYLRGYKFKNRLHNTLNLICSCGNEIATVSHFFLQFSKFTHERLLLLTLFTVENFMSELWTLEKEVARCCNLISTTTN